MTFTRKKSSILFDCSLNNIVLFGTLRTTGFGEYFDRKINSAHNITLKVNEARRAFDLISISNMYSTFSRSQLEYGFVKCSPFLN